MKISVLNPDTGATVIYSNEVSEAIRLEKNVVEAQKAFDEKKTGHHPHHLALALQKAKMIKNAAVNEIRAKFHVVK